MPSLKQTLRTTIQTKRYVPLNELHQIADDLGRKQSTAERRLRDIVEANEAEPVVNKKKFIIGYRWLNEPKQLNLI